MTSVNIEYNPKDDVPGLRPDPIPWPADPGAPKWLPLEPAPQPQDALPVADVLVVTYTVAEGEALADVLTPGHAAADWTAYKNNWANLKPMLGKGAPALREGCAARWALCQIGDQSTEIGNTTVVLVKSNFHPSTDGPRLPMAGLWAQMIEQVRPRLVLTTGTAGGVGADTLLGDVIVTSKLRWDCTTKFKSQKWAQATHTSDGGQRLLSDFDVQRYLGVCEKSLLKANAAKLPTAIRTPLVIDSIDTDVETITTDFFAFDDAADHYGLRAYEPTARAVEMDDAALGLVCSSMEAPPPWLSVRNASDPQMNGPNVRAEDKQAAAIYRKYGYWTTVNSAITCWAIIAGMGS
jgi:nucleoside phosphorylase